MDGHQSLKFDATKTRKNAGANCRRYFSERGSDLNQRSISLCTYTMKLVEDTNTESDTKKCCFSAESTLLVLCHIFGFLSFCA